VLHCGVYGWDVLMKRKGAADYMYLAKTTGSSISHSVTYIVFLTEMQKRQIPEKGFALIKTISNIFDL